MEIHGVYFQDDSISIGKKFAAPRVAIKYDYNKGWNTPSIFCSVAGMVHADEWITLRNNR
jgi:hypothetical protein